MYKKDEQKKIRAAFPLEEGPLFRPGALLRSRSRSRKGHFPPKSASRAPQERPRPPQERPRAPQERPKSSQECLKSAQERPKSAPRAAKSAQESPKSAPRACAQKIILKPGPLPGPGLLPEPVLPGPGPLPVISFVVFPNHLNSTALSLIA